MRLGVNIDHVATLRQARKDVYPNLLEAARLVFDHGGDGITIHLREDRRHIQDADVFTIRQNFPDKHLNLEMAAVEKIAAIALQVKPNAVCLVPEKRQEITTEGGLDVVRHYKKILQICQGLQAANIEVSLFIAPDNKQIDAAAKIGADHIELHTGAYGEYSDTKRPQANSVRAEAELKRLLEAAQYALDAGLKVNAGHGLTYENVRPIAARPDLFTELNIGHNIVARALTVGLGAAVAEMKALLRAG
jgi:pyridoxine 5-phosphate synthase